MLTSLSGPEFSHNLTLQYKLGCLCRGDCTIPRYFFHLVKDGETVAADMSGHECADDRGARQHAQSGCNLFVSRDLAAASLKGYGIQVENEAGQVLFTVALSKLQVT